MKRTFIIFTLLASFIGFVLWYGYTIPETHTASVSEYFANKKPPDIWKVIIEHELYPSWHEDVYAIKDLPPKNDYKSWKEVDANGNTVPYIIESHSPNVQLIIQSDDDSLDFSVKRTYDIIPENDGKGTTLKITEEGQIHNFLFRVIAHFLTGHTSDMDTFLRSMKNKFALEKKNQTK